MWTRSRQTLVSIHGGLSPPFAQVLFKWRIWERNSVLATRLKCVQTIELCLRSHMFLRYNKTDYKTVVKNTHVLNVDRVDKLLIYLIWTHIPSLQRVEETSVP